MEKFSLIDDHLSLIEEWYEPDIDLKTKYAIYKIAQEIIEAITDVIAMITKDTDQPVKDDYSNIDLLEENNVIDEDKARTLREANGLRNRLVHHYNGIDDTIALQSLMRLHPELTAICKDLREWIQRELRS